jgi:multisubunit Na+/H+ antiporter MnhG subunit
MRTTTKRRARQLALVTLAAPVAAWAMEQAAHRAEARDKASPDTTITWRQQPPQPDQHRG